MVHSSSSSLLLVAVCDCRARSLLDLEEQQQCLKVVRLFCVLGTERCALCVQHCEAVFDLWG